MSNSSLVNYVKISPNRTSPRRGKISKIVIHHMAGNLSVETCGRVFAPSSRQASSHYGIGSDGRIGMYCPESDRAWTTGHQIDHQAVTIEVADDVIGGNWHSSAKAMESLVKLCADICRRNGIKNPTYTGNGNGTFLMHKWYQATDCPGNYLASQFPWIAQQVNNLLNNGSYTAPSGSVVTINPEDKGYLMKGDTGSAVKTMQTMLIACGYSCGASSVDGSFGNDTRNALMKFQQDNKLEVDGYYGNESKAALTAKYNAIKNSTSSTTKPSVSKPITTSKTKLEVDGSWGKNTTLALQRYLGTMQDGIVSGQPDDNKRYLSACSTTSWEFKEGKCTGSHMVRKLQKLVGAGVDGYMGKNSVTSLQRFLKGKGFYTGAIDGSCGKQTVKALQSFLNAN